jgi:hypothetical protein
LMSPIGGEFFRARTRGRARVANVIVIVIVMFTRQDFFVIVIHASRLFRPVARRTRERDARFARDDGDDDAED